MERKIALLLCGILLMTSTAAAQVVIPAVNMGGTSFNDGVAGPGVLIEPGVLEYFHAGRFVDGKGNTIPGPNSVDALANLFHLGYITTRQIFGGFWGMEVLVPVASIDINTAFGPKGKSSGLGDIVVTPLIIEWPNHKLFGKTYFSRFSILAVLPTGAYDPESPVNVGSNSGSAFAYYSFTIMPRSGLETSWRINYLWNARNTQPFTPLATASTQAGQAIHGNYAISYALTPNLRVGANGYVLQQLNDHRMGGTSLPGSKERVVAIGPGVVWSSGFWSAFANVDFETLAQNRPVGQRVNVTFRRVFPHMPPNQVAPSSAMTAISGAGGIAR
jgi:hypothetical protein